MYFMHPEYLDLLAFHGGIRVNIWAFQIVSVGPGITIFMDFKNNYNYKKIVF